MGDPPLLLPVLDNDPISLRAPYDQTSQDAEEFLSVDLSCPIVVPRVFVSSKWLAQRHWSLSNVLGVYWSIVLAVVDQLVFGKG